MTLEIRNEDGREEDGEEVSIYLMTLWKIEDTVNSQKKLNNMYKYIE
jgi:hypothetical protein